MKIHLDELVSVEVFPRSVDLFSNECRISLDEKAMLKLIELWQSAQLENTPTIIKDFPMRDAYPQGYKPRRRGRE